MGGMLTRRQLLRSTALLSGGLALVAACGPAPAAPLSTSAATSVSAQAAASTPASTSAPAATAASAPNKGGTLRIGLSVDIATLDPHLSGSKFDRQVYHNLYDPLFVLDEKLGIQPNLAESYQTPDPQTLIPKLRSGVKFHDGTPLDAKAAVWNWERMYKKDAPQFYKRANSYCSYIVDVIKNVEAVDDRTVKMTFTTPFVASTFVPFWTMTEPVSVAIGLPGAM